MGNTEYQKAPSDDKINKKYKTLGDLVKKSSQENGEPVKDLPKHTPPSKGSYTSPFDTDMMSWSEMARILEDVNTSIEATSSDPLAAPIESEPSTVPVDTNIEDKVISQLNDIFTPVLVMQSFETQINDQIKESFEKANVLTERNTIRFDDETRMSQLIATCSLLIDKERQTPEYKAYEQATMVKDKTKVEICKKNYDLAKSIVQKYLVKVSTTNNSSEARNAATDLLPQTQH